MKKFTHRLLPLALCFSLTLGAFAYRPSEAKAIAGVDDAVVIGALLSAFAGGCGLIFSNNGMTSGELAQGLTDKWNEFNEAAENAASSFAAWLGFENTSALLGALSFSGGKLTIPRAVARKFADFTTWLTQNLGVTAGGDSASVAGGSHVALYQMSYQPGLGIVKDSTISVALSSFSNRGYDFSLGSPVCSILDLPASKDDALIFGFTDKVNSRLYAKEYDSSFYIGGARNTGGSTLNWDGNSYLKSNLASYNVYLFRNEGSSYYQLGVIVFSNVNGGIVRQVSTLAVGLLDASNIDVALTNSRLSVFAPSYYKTPTIDLPAEGEEAANPTLSGVGDGTATSVEELLQKILEQLQANTLAPTLDLAGTETGGNTGTDEDAKPYLPYIPQIFEKIKELPGTLANIWESIKGIPAAIAEKIGAFFTTLWGWLQNIIDAITALPAAIAEKVGALFKPDEALLTEITDAFKGKFGFFSTLKQFGNDLFGMTPETEPPVIWVHLENAESKFGYNYGDKQKIFDMTWYQKYKASVDGLLSGFLWLGYLWLLFKRAPSILNGMQMDEDLRPPLLVGDVSSAPRLGAGDPSIHYGEGFTFRSKGGKRK